jgi:hypothetical protein
MTDETSEDNDLAVLQTALAHGQSWIELHTNQRQNLLNFFLVAVAFLFNAYVSSISAHRYALAGSIAFLGAFISLAFTAMDLRNRDLTRAGEVTVRDIEERLARKCSLPSLRIIEAIDLPRHPWLSIGKIIRSIHVCVGIVFLGVAIYALVL